jgi:hypothetical protein
VLGRMIVALAASGLWFSTKVTTSVSVTVTIWAVAADCYGARTSNAPGGAS